MSQGIRRGCLCRILWSNYDASKNPLVITNLLVRMCSGLPARTLMHSTSLAEKIVMRHHHHTSMDFEM